MTFDHAALAARAFDAPWDPDVAEALRVCADALEAQGDPRGALMSLGFAPPSREVHAAIDEIGKDLLGDLGPISRAKRALRVEWRAGALIAARVDTRRIRAAPNEIIRGLCATSELRTLRHLWIRASPAQVTGLFAALSDERTPPPLEQLVIGPLARPGVSAYRMVVPSERQLLDAYPNLYLVGSSTIVPLDPPTTQTLAARTAELAAIGEVDADARRILGRGLVAPTLREAALAALVRLGVRAASLVELVGYLLQPRVVTDPLPLIACVEQLGRVAHDIWPILGAISGRAESYSSTVRRRAGMVYRDLR